MNTKKGREMRLRPTMIVIAVIFLLVGILIIGYAVKMPVTVADDKKTEKFDFDDVSDLPDETDYNETFPDEEPGEKDYSFSGSVTCEAKFLDSKGNALQMMRLAFYKYNPQGDIEIDKFSVSLCWEFKIGKDIKTNSFNVHITATLKTYYYSLEDPNNDGTLDAGKILDVKKPDLKGCYNRYWNIDDPDLRWCEVKKYGEDIVLWGHKQDYFVINWEAYVETDMGEPKKVKGSFGVGIYLIWEPEEDSYVATPDWRSPEGKSPEELIPYSEEWELFYFGCIVKCI